MDHMSYLVKYRHCHPTNFEQISNFESNFERYIQSFFFFCLFVFILYHGASRKTTQPNDKIIYDLLQQPVCN